MSIGNNLQLYTNNEGGNIVITSPNGIPWEIDAYNNNLRFFSNTDNWQCFTFGIDGEFSSTKGTFLNATNYSNYALPLSGGTVTGGIIVQNGTQTPLYVKGLTNNEASINYQHPDIGYQWVVGMGCGGLGGNHFSFYNTGVGIIAHLNYNGTFRTNFALEAGGNARLWTDGEGGNLSLIGNEGTKWSIDALGGNLRLIVNESSVPITFYTDGTISTVQGDIMTKGAFSLSGNTLAITV